MPINIVDGPEPLSARSLGGAPSVLIESDASRLLSEELRRYCNEMIGGRSFLIAGHRGAGKTTVVAKAFLDVLRESDGEKTRLRPLYVLMHGPSLFPSDDTGEVEPDEAKKDDKTPKSETTKSS